MNKIFTNTKKMYVIAIIFTIVFIYLYGQNSFVTKDSTKEKITYIANLDFFAQKEDNFMGISLALCIILLALGHLPDKTYKLEYVLAMIVFYIQVRLFFVLEYASIIKTVVLTSNIVLILYLCGIAASFMLLQFHLYSITKSFRLICLMVLCLAFIWSVI